MTATGLRLTNRVAWARHCTPKVRPIVTPLRDSAVEAVQPSEETFASIAKGVAARHSEVLARLANM